MLLFHLFFFAREKRSDGKKNTEGFFKQYLIFLQTFGNFCGIFVLQQVN